MRKTKTNKITYLFPLFLLLILVTFKINSSYPKSESPLPLAVSEEEVIADKGLSFPTSRTPSRTNFRGWREYVVEESGISFYYPPSWSVSGSTIQSWTTVPNSRPRPLKGSESKWDMGLSMMEPKPISLEDAFLRDTNIRSFQNFEVSKTISGKTIYFAEPIYAEEYILSESTYSVVAIIQTKDGYYRWFGFGPDPDYANSEILKQIVESIH